jgi:sugar O-acyltransferase (sialic acid O-acetyltransferase NeuD family)
VERILLIGAGGHFRVVMDAIGSAGVFEPVAILDPGHAGERIHGIPVSSGDDADLRRWRETGVALAHVTVGSLGDPSCRIELATRLETAGFVLAVIRHPSAVVSPSAVLGAGTYVGPGAVVGAASTLGGCCIVNTGALIDHDCEIGDFVHVAPGVTLSGAVRVGERSHLGTGATVIQRISIGSDTVVGAGSVVVRDLPDRVVAFGSPCKVRSAR